MRHNMDSLTLRAFALLLLGVLLAAGITSWLAAQDKHQSLRELHTSILQNQQERVAERLEQFVHAMDSTEEFTRPPLWRLGQRMGILPLEFPGLERLDIDHKLSERLSETLDRQVVMRRGIPRLCAIARPGKRRQGSECYVAQLSLQWQEEFGRQTEQVALLISAPRLPRKVRMQSIQVGDGVTLFHVRPLPPHSAQQEPVTERAGNGKDKLTNVQQQPLLRAWFFEPWWLSALIMASLLLLVAWIVARLVMRPLDTLTRAAESFSRNMDNPDLELSGPYEIRSALSAFNRMQFRIREHVSQRTQMLAAVTHDLQTPLTRLRLRLEKVSDDQLRQQLIEDLTDTQSRVREGLEFARSLEDSESYQVLDLDAMLDSMCADFAESGEPVVYDSSNSTNLNIKARPAAIRRCLENLINNAVKYGKQAEVSVLPDSEAYLRADGQLSAEQQDSGPKSQQLVCISIRDYGPGIPAAQLEAIFTPFTRLETSRSRQSGGTGLGLSIVRNLINRQGGRVSLRNHPSGGLQALLWIPST